VGTPGWPTKGRPRVPAPPPRAKASRPGSGPSIEARVAEINALIKRRFQEGRSRPGRRRPVTPRRRLTLHPNAIHSKLSQELAAVEARIMARLDEVEARSRSIEARFDLLIERLSRPPAPRKEG
jgi:hypothetical protein